VCGLDLSQGRRNDFWADRCAAGGPEVERKARAHGVPSSDSSHLRATSPGCAHPISTPDVEAYNGAVAALDLTLRIIGVVLLSLLASLMLRARRRDHTARIGAALAISVAAFMLTSMDHAGELLGVFVYPLSAICATHPVWFWLFCTALFSDHMKLSRRHVVCLAAMAIAGLAYTSLAQPVWRADAPAFTTLLGTLFGAASLGFVCLGPLAVYLGRRTDLDERRLKIRTWFVPLVSGYLVCVVLVQIYTVIAARATPEPLVLFNLAVIDSVAAAALLTFVQIRVCNWLDLVEPAPDVDSLSRVERSVLDRLTRRLVPERLYAREGLSIAVLAATLDTQEYVLRRVINRGLGFRNFNDFLHSHRLREAAVRLREPAERRIPVLTIALDVGYGSIGPFNRAFRERFGMTPTEYRRDASPGAQHHGEGDLEAHPSSSRPA
jgi:AraC-like DNA-binding protein